MFNIPINICGEFLLRFPSLNKYLLNYRSESLRIVYYHMVSEIEHSYYFPNKAISPYLFRKQIRFFRKHYDIISLNQAIQMSKENISLKKKLVITFDDGFRENHSIIAPILSDEKITATFFLITNCIDNRDLMWRNKLIIINNIIKKSKTESILNDFHNVFHINRVRKRENLLSWSDRTWQMKNKEKYVNYLWNKLGLKPLEEFLGENRPYMTKGEIIELLNEGFSIGSHSLSHPNFSKLNYDEFLEEIVESVKILEYIFNIKINTFSYPFGERANPEFEGKLTGKFPSMINTFLGIKNSLNNNESIRWERDNLEFSDQEMMFRFSILPIIRKIIKI